MIPCSTCHRHIRSEESGCPFCGAALETTLAGSSARIPLLGIAASLTLLACGDPDDPNDSNAVTTDPTNSTSGMTLGDGDGDTQETEDWGGADYGGPGPTPCDGPLGSAVNLELGTNAVDTTARTNENQTTCADASGTGPDTVLTFTAPGAGTFDFSITESSFDAWLLEFGTYYCTPYDWGECMVNQGYEISMGEAQVLYLMLDGAAAGTATIEVTQIE